MKDTNLVADVTRKHCDFRKEGMFMKRIFILFLVMLAMLPISSAFADFIPLTFKNGDSVSIAARQWYELQLEGDPAKEMEWNSSNDDVFSVLPSRNNVIIATGNGSANLIGKAKDGSGDKVKIKITVPKVYTTADSITIDTPDGVEFGYAFNISGFLSVSMTGKCFSSERLEDVGEVTMSRLMPVKVGTGSIIFKSSGSTIKTVKVTVKKSAFEEKQSAEEVSDAAGAVGYAITNNSVNIRKEPTTDSSRMGAAKKGEKLTVTQAYYTDGWHQIIYDGKTCYVSAKFCDLKITETPAPSVQVTEEKEENNDAEAKLDQYIAEFKLRKACKTVIMENLPDFKNFDRIEQEGTSAYRIIMNDGTKYYLTVLKDKEPACLQSGEADYKTRTRYYDKFAK